MASKDGFTIENLPAFRRALEDAASKTRKGAEAAIREEVDAIHADAVRLAPHGKTGDLEKGIRRLVEGLVGTVRAMTRYSTFMEHGTYKDKAQPFMTPAAERARRRLPKRAAEIIRAFLGG